MISSLLASLVFVNRTKGDLGGLLEGVARLAGIGVFNDAEAAEKLLHQDGDIRCCLCGEVFHVNIAAGQRDGGGGIAICVEGVPGVWCRQNGSGNLLCPANEFVRVDGLQRERISYGRLAVGIEKARGLKARADGDRAGDIGIVVCVEDIVASQIRRDVVAAQIACMGALGADGGVGRPEFDVVAQLCIVGDFFLEGIPGSAKVAQTGIHSIEFDVCLGIDNRLNGDAAGDVAGRGNNDVLGGE